MELKSNLAEALFDKVITPIKDKMKRPITNIIVNKDEEKSALETLLLSIPENPTVLPAVPKDSNISESNKESVSDINKTTLPPPPPCHANDEHEQINLVKDCYQDPNTGKMKARAKSLRRYHPDKNQGCLEDAENKFKELTNMCEKLPAPEPSAAPQQPAPEPSAAPQPSSTEQPAPQQPAPEPSAAPQQPAPQPSAAPQQPAPQPSSTEQLAPQPSSTEEPATLKPSVEVVQELPNDNTAIKQLVQALIGVLRKPATSITATEPSVEVVQDLPKDNKAIKQLVQALIGVLRKPVSQPTSTVQQEITSCDIDETCQDQPVKPLVKILSNILSKQPTESIEEDKPKCFDMSGKFEWIKQALTVLFSTIGGLFTFEPVQDTDPYELREDKKNQGYIYVGKMFMKPEDSTKKAESVKYISYHPEKKDFFIDEQKEV